MVDGKRDPNTVDTRAATRATRIVDGDGKPLGWSAQQQGAKARRAGL